MFFIKTIRLSKKYSNENKIILLFDATISVPCLYPLLYSMKSSISKYSYSTIRFMAIKFWYEFWFQNIKQFSVNHFSSNMIQKSI
jgi:hypothetical protein